METELVSKMPVKKSPEEIFNAVAAALGKDAGIMHGSPSHFHTGLSKGRVDDRVYDVTYIRHGVTSTVYVCTFCLKIYDKVAAAYGHAASHSKKKQPKTSPENRVYLGGTGSRNKPKQLVDLEGVSTGLVTLMEDLNRAAVFVHKNLRDVDALVKSAEKIRELEEENRNLRARLERAANILK